MNKDGKLAKDECKVFIQKLVSVIDFNRAQNYNPDNFEAIFEGFDEDKNSFLSKVEMAMLIKKVFRKPG